MIFQSFAVSLVLSFAKNEEIPPCSTLLQPISPRHFQYPKVETRFLGIRHYLENHIVQTTIYLLQKHKKILYILYLYFSESE